MVGEMKANEQTVKPRLSHSRHKHNSEVQGNISGDYEERWADAMDGL